MVFKDEAAVEAPSEGAEIARQVFGADHTVGGQEAVLDVSEHRVRPAEGRVAGSGATGASDVALVDDTRLLGDTAKPLAAVADDRGSGRDTGAQAFGFAGPKSAHDLEAGVQRPTVRGGLDRDDKRRVSAATATGPFADALAADVSLVDLDPRAGGAELVTTVSLEQWPASACAGRARQRWLRSRAAGPARCWIGPSCPGRADAWRETTSASAVWCPAGLCRRSAIPGNGIAGTEAVGTKVTTRPYREDIDRRGGSPRLACPVVTIGLRPPTPRAERA